MESVSILMDAEVKKAAQELFARLGIDMSTAINMFLRQSVHQNTLTLDFPPKGSKVKLGGWEGKIWMADDFDEPLEDFKEYM